LNYNQERTQSSRNFEKIFEHILREAVEAGFADASAIFIDAAHIKANANNHKYTNEIIKSEARHYPKELFAYLNVF
jgi:transposase